MIDLLPAKQERCIEKLQWTIIVIQAPTTSNQFSSENENGYKNLTALKQHCFKAFLASRSCSNFLLHSLRTNTASGWVEARVFDWQ